MLQDRPLVTVAVLTFRRPEDLSVVLPRLVDQALSVTSVATAEVVVVDNDPDGGARATVEALAASNRGKVSVRYLHEPEPGISAGRNRALNAAADSDILVFIDDDERPADGWLLHLLDTHARLRPAAVVGPVESEFGGPVDPWILAGDFFGRHRLKTGTVVPVAATNNLLLDMRLVRETGLQFDPTFGLIGGGDTMFTRQLVKAGGVIVWCDEALVYDRVPVSRLTRRWVLQRSLRSGNSWSITSILLSPSACERTSLRLGLTVLGAARFVWGSIRIALGFISRNAGGRARGFKTLMRGIGMIGGAWGYRYGEYRRPAPAMASR